MPGMHWETDRKWLGGSFPIAEGSGRHPAGRSQEAVADLRLQREDALKAERRGARKKSGASPPRPLYAWLEAAGSGRRPGAGLPRGRPGCCPGLGKQVGGLETGCGVVVPAKHRPGTVTWPSAEGSAQGGGGRGAVPGRRHRGVRSVTPRKCPLKE